MQGAQKSWIEPHRIPKVVSVCLNLLGSQVRAWNPFFDGASYCSSPCQMHVCSLRGLPGPRTCSALYFGYTWTPKLCKQWPRASQSSPTGKNFTCFWGPGSSPLVWMYHPCILSSPVIWILYIYIYTESLPLAIGSEAQSHARRYSRPGSGPLLRLLDAGLGCCTAPPPL